jgi:hypothetical protein
MIPVNGASVRIWPRQDVVLPWPGKTVVSIPQEGADIVWGPRWLSLFQSGAIHLHDPVAQPATSTPADGG